MKRIITILTLFLALDAGHASNFLTTFTWTTPAWASLENPVSKYRIYDRRPDGTLRLAGIVDGSTSHFDFDTTLGQWHEISVTAIDRSLFESKQSDSIRFTAGENGGLIFAPDPPTSLAPRGMVEVERSTNLKAWSRWGFFPRPAGSRQFYRIKSS